jgi:hypothetical protein
MTRRVLRLPRSTVAAAALATVASLAWPAAPAGAHSGGRAQLYVESVRLEPQPGGWLTTIMVRDADSGRPEPGFGVQITAAGPGGRAVGPVDLTDPDADGRYAALVPVTEGGWALTVDADEMPGGARALPFKKTWPVTLATGQALDLAGSRPSGTSLRSGGGHSAVPPVLGLMAASALAALLSLGLGRRRRTGSGRGPGGQPRPWRRAPRPG